MSSYDTASLYQFLQQTPEQGLRKMLVDNKPFTDSHFSMLIKIIRGSDESAFSNHFDKQDFPKLKFGPAETKIKDKFWSDCVSCFSSRGILSPAQNKKAA